MSNCNPQGEKFGTSSDPLMAPSAAPSLLVSNLTSFLEKFMEIRIEIARRGSKDMLNGIKFLHFRKREKN